MGFKYTDKVYKNVANTSATEQLVLLTLAHMANDKTGECFPSLETLVKRTHLNRSSVRRNLDSLKEQGLLKWISGGRKKKGRVLSNLYKLTLPNEAKEREKDDVLESWSAVDNSQGRGSLCTPYQAHSEPTKGLTVRPLPGSQCAPIINRTIIYQSDDHNPPADAAEELPGRFDFGVARRNGTLDDVLKRVGDANKEMRRAEEMSLIQFAMEAAETQEFEDRKTFAIVTLRKDADDCREEIYRFASEKRAGEFKKIRNLPALLTARLKELPDVR